MTSDNDRRAALIVTADDYGLWPSYDRGILEAARAGAVDAASVMVSRDRLDPAPLLETGVELGLHLELRDLPPGRAGAEEREYALRELRSQLGRFEEILGRSPAYIDGHHHCHAAPGLGAAIGREALARGLPLRSVSAPHRRTLRCQGVATPDALIGRSEQGEAALPPEVEAVLSGSDLPPGATEWMVHPGHPDAGSGSSYDRARGEDLELVLRLVGEPSLRAVRATHGEALAAAAECAT